MSLNKTKYDKYILKTLWIQISTFQNVGTPRFVVEVSSFDYLIRTLLVIRIVLIYFGKQMVSEEKNNVFVANAILFQFIFNRFNDVVIKNFKVKIQYSEFSIQNSVFSIQEKTRNKTRKNKISQKVSKKLIFKRW